MLNEGKSLSSSLSLSGGGVETFDKLSTGEAMHAISIAMVLLATGWAVVVPLGDRAGSIVDAKNKR